MVTAANAKDWARENIVGLFCSPLTVFDDELELDLDGLAANVEYIMRIGVEGMGYGHSEPWCLSHQERRDSAATFIEAVGGRAATYIHSHDHSAPETVALTQHAADIGADLAMIEPPYEHAKTEQMIFDYFAYITDRTDIGIILLNTPHSGRLMSPELIDRLADLPAVCALKDGINDYDLHSAIHERVGDRIVTSMPYEASAIRCVVELDQQVQLGTSAVYLLQDQDWHPVRAFFELARAGRVDEAEAIFASLAPLRDLWVDMVSVLWTEFPEHPIAIQKVWMDAIGMAGGKVRPPWRNLSADEVRQWTERVHTAQRQARESPMLAGLG